MIIKRTTKSEMPNLKRRMDEEEDNEEEEDNVVGAKKRKMKMKNYKRDFKFKCRYKVYRPVSSS